MNHHIQTQCQNMIATIRIFEQACELAATQDDAAISKTEAKILRRIRTASKRFMRELKRIV